MALAAAGSSHRPAAAPCLGDTTTTTIGTAIPLAQSLPPTGSLRISRSTPPGTPTAVTHMSAAAPPAPWTSAGPKGGAVGKRAVGGEDITLCSRASREPHPMVGLSRILATFIFSSSDKRSDLQLLSPVTWGPLRHEPRRAPGERFHGTGLTVSARRWHDPRRADCSSRARRRPGD